MALVSLSLDRRWNATIERIIDLQQFAITLAQFLFALQRIDPAGGPPPGSTTFSVAGRLEIYDKETRNAIAALSSKIDGNKVTAVWEAALESIYHGTSVWIHGDVSASNLLVREGHLHAVIDFGCSGIGDPACDLTIAWTFLSGKAREVLKSVLSLDSGTWARARGWALWKGLISLAEHIDTNQAKANEAGRVIEEVLADQSHVM